MDNELKHKLAEEEYTDEERVMMDLERKSKKERKESIDKKQERDYY